MGNLVFALIVVTIFGDVESISFPPLDALKPQASPEDQGEAVRDLLGRLLPDRVAEFQVTVDPALGPKDHDTYKLNDGPRSGQIQITGSSGVAAALGLHNYLKQWGGCYIAWSGVQLNLSTPLPPITTPVKVTTPDRFRYYQNICTPSYSSLWWDWARWEREIDWMALNGINLPLVVGGQEELWRRVYIRLGFNQSELNDFFTGPAFLAWNRMGNVDGWGGPLPTSWHVGQLSLQKQIVNRMRKFGMIPVLPGFSGHVPRSLPNVFPNANVTSLKQWGNFNTSYCCTSLLDPTDPLFVYIATEFMEEQNSELGTDHIYSCDTFNEMDPASNDPEYLRSVGESVLRGMTASDPKAVWLMQGWLFESAFWQPVQAEALLTSVPAGRMLILDLQAEQRPKYSAYESFYGQPFIWCMLHNFGGVLGLYGFADAVNEGPFVARDFANSTMVGTGLTMEGIEQNEVMYELMNEMAWRDGPVNLGQWFVDYARRRYGSENDPIATAWNLLSRSVYNCTEFYAQHGGYVIVKRPSLALVPPLWYDPTDLWDSWSYFLEGAEELGDSVTFRYDLTDVTRESLQTLANQHYHRIVNGFRHRNQTEVTAGGALLLDLLHDLDAMLGTDVHYLLGQWVEAAKAMGTTAADKDLYEYNARNQITMWGPDGNILDYAAKQWSGLVNYYYRPRWNLFVKRLLRSLATGKPYNQGAFNKLVLKNLEQPFSSARNVFPVIPSGDTVDVARNLFKKWHPTADFAVLNNIRKQFEKTLKHKRITAISHS